jgi:hypothetical protein
MPVLPLVEQVFLDRIGQRIIHLKAPVFRGIRGHLQLNPLGGVIEDALSAHIGPTVEFVLRK